MSFDFGVGDIVVATSLVLRLIKHLQDVNVLQRYTEDAPVFFAILVEVKDLIAGSPDAIPASARAALELVEHRQSSLIFKVRESGLSSEVITNFQKAQLSGSFASVLFRNKAQERANELNKLLDMWKSSVLLLRELTIDSITHHLLRHSSSDLKVVLAASAKPTAHSAMINVTIATPTGEQAEITTRAELDTGASGVWVTRPFLKRASLLENIHPIRDEDLRTYKIFDGTDYTPNEEIELSWFPNNEKSQMRITTFLVNDNGPFEVLFGIEYVVELAGVSRTPALIAKAKVNGGLFIRRTTKDQERKMREAELLRDMIDEPQVQKEKDDTTRLQEAQVDGTGQIAHRDSWRSRSSKSSKSTMKPKNR
ncbi:hypothetical protein BGZ60DRAFT_526491 [Tricladium varicosporioides]|nr:hypothetical protein BGZ60DRAFT_526491 [Hymenoscyphus varicosporioides]